MPSDHAASARRHRVHRLAIIAPVASLLLVAGLTAISPGAGDASAADGRREIRQVWLSTADRLFAAEERWLFQDQQVGDLRFDEADDPEQGGLAGSIRVSMTDHDAYDNAVGHIDLSFSPASFSPGRYGAGGRPGGMSVSNGSNLCSSAGGSFTIHRIDRETRALWLSFTLFCSHEPTYGEVRIGVDAPTAAGVVGPGFVRLPDANLEGANRVEMPYVNGGSSTAIPVSDVAVGPHGEDARQIVISAWRCRMEPGEACWAYVTAAPRDEGQRRWRTVSRWNDGATLVTQVQQEASAGHDYGIYRAENYLGDIGEAVTGPEVDATGYVDARGTVVDAVPGLRLTGPAGEPRLQVGRYEDVDRWPFQDLAPGLSSSSAPPCLAGFADDSWFEVGEVAYEPGGMLLQRLAVTFDVSCEREFGRFRGMVGVNASDPPPALPGYLSTPGPRCWPKTVLGYSRIEAQASRRVSPPGARVTISGRLVSDQTGQPLAGETVKLERMRNRLERLPTLRVRTDEQGRFAVRQRARGRTRITPVFARTCEWRGDHGAKVWFRAAGR
ncbi:carboxypeptidase-like regulatory domain-containing protein [Nocardioidaceae bacterium]|nr:carboxypeptidase-like regulatory domain-containing protein [Nocardioidaceae bacterium]